MAAREEQIVLHVKDFLGTLSGRFRILSAYLFGSHAEGRAGPYSDIDIGIVLDGRAGIEERQQLYFAGKEFDVDFDVVALSKGDFDREDPVIVHEIKTKGIRIA